MDNAKTVLHVGTLIDSKNLKPLSNMLIFITGDRITEILEFNEESEKLLNRDFELIDLRGFTVMSGMIDAHMHFFGVPSINLDQMMTENDAFRGLRASREASEMLQAGITSARCLGSSISPSLKRAIDSGVVPGPRLIVSGQFICASNGTWDHVKVPVEKMRAAGMLADGVDELRQKVRERLREGASAIKIGLSIGAVGDIYHAWGDDPENAVASYSIEEILAATEEAHKNRIKVSAHCIGDTAVMNAVLGGVDVIEHGYPISPKTRKMVADKGILITSTASQLFYHNEAAEKFGYSEGEKILFLKHEESMQKNFELGLEAKIRYCLGSDLIGPPTHAQNLFAKEYEIAVNWGMTSMQAIIAGTAVSAEALGMQDDIGTVEKGKFADLIAMRISPTVDIKQLQDVKFVMQGGKIIRNETTPDGKRK
jgi:imidazolonepropionase-like amidohydrolase